MVIVGVSVVMVVAGMISVAKHFVGGTTVLVVFLLLLSLSMFIVLVVAGSESTLMLG